MLAEIPRDKVKVVQVEHIRLTPRVESTRFRLLESSTNSAFKPLVSNTNPHPYDKEVCAPEGNLSVDRSPVGR